MTNMSERLPNVIKDGFTDHGRHDQPSISFIRFLHSIQRTLVEADGHGRWPGALVGLFFLM